MKKNITNINKTRFLGNRKIKYIVLHYTANNGDTAYGNTCYFKSVNRLASAHYFVDDKSVWQCVEDNNVAWHCGGVIESRHHPLYHVATNTNSLGIEMCSRKNSKGEFYITDATIKRTAKLVRKLMKKYNIPYQNVIRHFDVTGKYCPAPYVSSSAWKKLREELPILSGAPKKAVTPKSNTMDIAYVQALLNKVLKKDIAVDGEWGSATTKALKNVYKKMDWKAPTSNKVTKSKLKALKKIGD